MEEEVMEEQKGKWKIQGVGKLIKDSLIAILHGQFLMRLNIGRYLVHIVFTFLLFALTIWFSLKVDTTLTKVENNRKALKELEIQHANMEFELRTINRRAAIEEMLKEQDSKVTIPQQPATVLKK